MTSEPTGLSTPRQPAMLNQTIVVIGASAGIGLETARQARAAGAQVVLTGRNPERLQDAARELEALSTAAFDATDSDRLKQFFSHPASSDQSRDDHGRRPPLHA